MESLGNKKSMERKLFEMPVWYSPCAEHRWQWKTPFHGLIRGNGKLGRD